MPVATACVVAMGCGGGGDDPANETSVAAVSGSTTALVSSLGTPTRVAASSIDQILMTETSGTSKDVSMAGSVCSPDAAAKDASVAMTKDAGWDTIAQEWQVVQFASAASRTLRFGHADAGWVQKTTTDMAASCTAWYFGSDPAPGIIKSCEQYTGSVPPPAPPPGSSTWTFLLNEWQSMQFPDASARRVRFGHSSRGWYEKDVTNALQCTSSFFDNQDPAPGVVKVCEQASGSAPSPAPSPSGTWAYLTSEWNRATFPDSTPRTVRYGHASHGWQQKAFVGSVYCSTSSFDGIDPAWGVPKTCEVLTGASTPPPPAPTPPPPAPTPPPPPAPTPPPPAPTPPPPPGGVYIDASKIPAGSPGLSRDVIEAAAESPFYADGIGAFRTVCDYSHMNFDDAIIYPGQPGKSHLHTYFGNKNTNAYSTPESLLATGAATCRGGTANRSGYWVPSMIDTRDGRPVAPSRMVVYYKSGYWGVSPQQVNALPVGLRMIGGLPSAKTPQGLATSHFSCSVDGVQRDGVPASCAVGATIDQTIRFPQCWDGRNLDSPDHRSHMSYPKPNYPYGCPTTHPVALPEVQFQVSYTVQPGDDMRAWRLASDMYETTSPGGYSNHADWINGWKPEVMNVWINQCVRKGLDCKGALLGDGRTLGGTYNEGGR